MPSPMLPTTPLPGAHPEAVGWTLRSIDSSRHEAVLIEVSFEG